LLKHDYAEAWRWYEQADRELPAPQPRQASQLFALLQDLSAPGDYLFFEYYCLTKLGRADEAKAKLAQFEETFFPKFPLEKPDPLLRTQIDGRPMEQVLQDVLDPNRLSGALLRDLYVAEVFLSVDAAADAEGYFRKSLEVAPTDPARLSSALVLAQLLLIEKKPGDYLDLVADVVAPLLVKLYKPPAGGPMLGVTDFAHVQDGLCQTAGGLTVLPLLAPDFVAGLPEDRLRAALPKLKTVAEKAGDDQSRMAFDLFFHTAYQRLGMEKEREWAAERLRRNPQVGETAVNEKARELIRETRAGLAALTSSP
jgi:tetratricopeptide (TPR) repeat protein